MAKTLEEKVDELITSNKQLSAAAAAKSGSGNSGVVDAFKDLPGVADKSKSALDRLSGAFGAGVEIYKKLEKGVTDQLDTFRDLSKTGASFSNDIVGMSAAAAGTRMNMQEFAGTIKDNAANFAGLGGNVTRGAEAFAKMSKEMFDSGATDYLKQMGYTAKDINEVLATQVSFQRSTIANDAAAQKRSIEAATELATEMDEMAKLTGKSRKEQEDNMKKAAMDMQVEAKMRLIGIKEGPEAEKKAREMYAKQYNEAQLRGQGQMFKEVFATGAVQSKEAGMQVALQGKAALDTISQAKATARGDTAAAEAANKNAKVSMDKLQNSAAYLSVAVTGVGEASKAAQEGMKENRGMYDAIRAVREDPKMKGKSDDEIQAEAKRRVQEAQAGKDAEGKDVSGATKAVIQLGNRMGDANSAIMNGLVKPLNEKVSPALSKVADITLAAERNVRNKQTGKVEKTTFATELETAGAKGFKKGAEGETGESEQPRGRRGKVAQGGSGPSGAMETAGEVLGTIGTFTASSIDKMYINDKIVPKHAEGAFVPKPELALIGEAGPEFVLNQPQMKGLIEGVGKMGAGNALGGIDLGKIAKDIGKESGAGTIDIGKISKDISTTFSGMTAPATAQTPAMKAQSAIDDAIKAKEEALAKVNKMLNEGSDEELDSAWKEMEEAKEKLSKVIDSSIGDLSSGFDDVGTVMKDSPMANPMANLDTSGIVLGPNGMPMPGSIKAKAATIPEDPKKKEAEQRRAAETKQAEEDKKKTEAKKKDEKPAGSSKETTLSDVVNKLDSLNNTMNRLLATSEDLGSKQVKATKSVAASGNLYAR